MTTQLVALLQYPEAVALVAAGVGWLVVAIARKAKGLPEDAAGKLRSHTTALVTGALVYAVPLVYAALQTGAAVDWLRIVLGAVMAAIGPSGIAEAIKAQVRRAAIMAGGEA